MVLDMAKPKNRRRKYHVAWNAWKRCCKKVDSQGGHFTGIHDRFPRGPVYRESQLAIGWTEQKCKELDELAKEDHTYHLTPEEQRRYLSHLEQVRQKMSRWNFDPIFELLSLSTIVYTTSQAKKLKILFLQNNTRDGIPLQAHRGGTSLNRIAKWAHKIFFQWSSFCYSWFRLVDGDPL